MNIISSLRIFGVCCLVMLSMVGGKASAATLILNDHGLAPITADTPFMVAAIRALFPDYTVKSGVRGFEDQEIPTIELYDKKTKLLSLEEDDRHHIGIISVLSNRVKQQDGAPIGTLFASIYPAAAPYHCGRGAEQESPYSFCSKPGSTSVTYVFAGRWDGPDSEVPPRTVLNSWKLVWVEWSPPMDGR